MATNLKLILGWLREIPPNPVEKMGWFWGFLTKDLNFDLFKQVGIECLDEFFKFEVI